jgi:hypothetical protein
MTSTLFVEPEPEQDYCVECGCDIDPFDEDYWGFCSVDCYEEFERSLSS